MLPTNLRESARPAAEEAYARFLSNTFAAEEQAFEALCKRLPHMAADLRLLRKDWLCLPGMTDLDEAGVKTVAAPQPPTRSSSWGSENASQLLERLTARNDRGGRYEVRREVARGGMGLILQAWDRDLRRNLAMKVIRGKRRGLSGAGTDTERELSRFLEEAQVTGQLEHPGVVPVHELGLNSEGLAYFTMPLVRGRNFKQIIELVHRGHPDWSQTRALGVVIKVCETLGYAHSRGVIHRDIKPTNIMVGPFGETYVMDWGLARVMGREDSHGLRLNPELARATRVIETDRSDTKQHTPDSPLITRDGDVVGTPSYMAPEQARGQVEVLGPRSEVYAIGATLYHLLAGHTPYVEPGSKSPARAVLRKVLLEPPLPLEQADPDVQPELAAICAKAMAREPLERYSNTLEMAKDIEAYLGKRPVAASPSTLIYLIKLALHRHRPVVLTAAAALLALLTFGALFNHATRVSESHERTARLEAVNALRAKERLLDVMAARALRAEEPTLYPAVPATYPAIQRWLDRAQDLLSRRQTYQREEASRNGADMEEGIELAGLLSNLTALEELLPAVQGRGRLAQDIAQRSLIDQAPAWQACIEAIAADPTYGGLELAPQLGLVPLGSNPDSGLWEFWHVASGERPAADAEGTFRLAEDSGIVLVLLPGGPLAFSGRAEQDGEETSPETFVEPFFLSKYEITQAQWRRAMRENPSALKAGETLQRTFVAGEGRGEITGLHPVESVNWTDCRRFVDRLLLDLPTEEQWEYACLCGAPGPWAWEEGPGGVAGRENVADRSAVKVSPFADQDLSDGHAFHAPVGCFEPNAFGFHDMLGNVSEWCSNLLTGHLEHADLMRFRAFRGASWYLGPAYCPATFRQGEMARGANFARGLRASRTLQP